MTERVIFSQQKTVERENLFLSVDAQTTDPQDPPLEPPRTTSDVIFPSEDFVRAAVEQSQVHKPEKKKSYVDQLKDQIRIHEEQLDFFMTQRAKNVMLEQAFQPKISTEHVFVTDFVANGLSDLLKHEEASHNAMADKIKYGVIPEAKEATGEKNGTGDYRTDDVPVLNIYAEAHHLMAGIARSKYRNITDDEGIVISPTHYFAQTHMKEAIEPAVMEAHDAFDARVKDIQAQKSRVARQIMTVKAFIAQGSDTPYLQSRVRDLEYELQPLEDQLAAIESEKERVFGRLQKMYEEIQSTDSFAAHEDEFTDYRYAKAA